MIWENFISTRQLVFQLLDLIAQARGRLVVFFRDSLFQMIYHGAHLVGKFQLPGSAFRQLAHMFGAFVHGLEERVEALGKGVVTGTASKPARFLEVRLREPANGTFLGGRALFDLLRRANA
jgi:hypothetical protein